MIRTITTPSPTRPRARGPGSGAYRIRATGRGGRRRGARTRSASAKAAVQVRDSNPHWPRCSASEDGLAVRLAFPHRTEGFLGTFHRQNGTDLGLDSSPSNQVYHLLHVIKQIGRAHV